MPTMQKEVKQQIIGVVQSGSLAAARATENKNVAVVATQLIPMPIKKKLIIAILR